MLKGHVRSHISILKVMNETKKGPQQCLMLTYQSYAIFPFLIKYPYTVY